MYRKRLPSWLFVSFDLLLYVPVKSYGHVGTLLPHFMGWDFYPAFGCHNMHAKCSYKGKVLSVEMLVQQFRICLLNIRQNCLKLSSNVISHRFRCTAYAARLRYLFYLIKYKLSEVYVITGSGKSDKNQ